MRMCEVIVGHPIFEVLQQRKYGRPHGHPIIYVSIFQKDQGNV